MLKKFPSWIWLALLTLLLLVPFVNKPANIDDTLFLWAAKQIQKQPWNFYGFSVNWYGVSQPMSEVTQNPPLASYYLALAGALTGWSEASLHIAMFLAAIAAVCGIFALAKNYCSNPVLAALIALLTPAFLISATTLMCDMLMLGLWVWSIVFWQRGLSQTRFAPLVVSGVLTGCCALTKFYGIALVPLLTVYTIIHKHGPALHQYFAELIQPKTTSAQTTSAPKKNSSTYISKTGTKDWLQWVAALAIPVIFLAGYECITRALYDRGLLLNAAGYASTSGQLAKGDYLSNATLGVLFTGGCLLPTLLFAPRVWPRWWWISGLCVLGVCGFFLASNIEPLERLFSGQSGNLKMELLLQAALFLVAGANVLLLGIVELWQRRDTVTWLLVLWLLGTFAFAAIVNWTVNGRSLLPMAPALAILIVRRMERRSAGGAIRFSLSTAWPLVPAAALCWPLMKADFSRANTDLLAAHELCAAYKKSGLTLWFEGHWGFQYYMQLLGAKSIDLSAARVEPGDIIVLPSDESNVYELPSGLARLLSINRYSAETRVATMSRHAGAGFYAREWGALPFVFRSAEPEQFFIFEAVRARDLAAEPMSKPQIFHGRVEDPNPPAVSTAEEMASWQKAIGTNANDAAAHFQLARLYLAQSNRVEAVREFAEVVRIHPEDGEAHLQLGMLTDDPLAAIEHYHESLRSAPDSVGALNNLAWLLATQRDPTLRNGPEAMQLARRAAVLTQNKTPVVLGTLAAACAQAGNFDDAVEAAKKAIRLARAAGDSSLVATNQQLLEFYQAHRPYPPGK